MGVAQAIDITAEQRRTVVTLLERHLPGTKAWVYGSRAKRTSTPQSDLDLVVFSKPEQRRQVGDLRDAFDESNLSFRVDLFVWSDVPRSFRKQIEAQHVVLQRNDTRSQPASHCRIAHKTQILKELICYTRDGEWGKGASHHDLIPMRVVRGTDFDSVRHGGVAGVPTRYIRRDVAAKKTLRPWDILIETAGGSRNRSTGRTLLVHPRILKCSDNSVTCASFARIVRIDPALAHPPYVYWYLQHLYSLGEMERNQVQHTGVARFQFTNFAANVEIPLPSIPEQETIAHILGTLDDRIELNHRMNATLEAMASALFKSWFVDYDHVRAKMEGRDTGLPTEIADLFPDRLVDSESGEAPMGWETGVLADAVEILGGGTPRTSVNHYWNGDIPWYTPRDAPVPSDVFVVVTEKTITQAGVDNSSTTVLPAGTTVISARGTVGRLACLGVPMAMNQTCYGIRGADAYQSQDYFVYWLVRGTVEELRSRTHGTVFDTITRQTFASVNLPLPPVSVAKEFELAVSPIMGRIFRNLHQVGVLTALRDTLLPELVSGKLRLPGQQRPIMDA